MKRRENPSDTSKKFVQKLILLGLPEHIGDLLMAASDETTIGASIYAKGYREAISEPHFIPSTEVNLLSKLMERGFHKPGSSYVRVTVSNPLNLSDRMMEQLLSAGFEIVGTSYNPLGLTWAPEIIRNLTKEREEKLKKDQEYESSPRYLKAKERKYSRKPSRRNPIASDPNLLAPNGRPIGVRLHTFKPKSLEEILEFFITGMNYVEIEAYALYQKNKSHQFFVTSQRDWLAFMVYDGEWNINNAGFWVTEPTQIVVIRDREEFLRNRNYGRYDSFLLWPLIQKGRSTLRIYRVKP
jgi:hypothetical protein